MKRKTRLNPLAMKEPRLGYAYTLVAKMAECAQQLAKKEQEGNWRYYHYGQRDAYNTILQLLEGEPPWDNDCVGNVGIEEYRKWLESRGEL